MLLKRERRTVFEKSEVQQFRPIDNQPTEDEKNEVSQESIGRVSLNVLQSIFTLINHFIRQNYILSIRHHSVFDRLYMIFDFST